MIINPHKYHDHIIYLTKQEVSKIERTQLITWIKELHTETRQTVMYILLLVKYAHYNKKYNTFYIHSLTNVD